MLVINTETDELQLRFESLPPLPELVEGEPLDHWTDKQRSIRQHIAERGIDDFLTWPEIVTTMFVGDAPYIPLEMATLHADGWGRWGSAMEEDDLGGPLCLPDHNWTSGSMVHQAYHLHQWEKATGIRVDSLSTIVEIGGGYGAMCKLIRRLGFTGRYIIYDLPELSFIQEWYLGKLGVDVELCSAPSLAPLDCDLLIALWSLSEMTDEQQISYLDSLSAKYVLVAALDAPWQGQNNNYYIYNVKSNYEKRPILHLPGNFYLLG